MNLFFALFLLSQIIFFQIYVGQGKLVCHKNVVASNPKYLIGHVTVDNATTGILVNVRWDNMAEITHLYVRVQFWFIGRPLAL